MNHSPIEDPCPTIQPLSGTEILKIRRLIAETRQDGAQDPEKERRGILRMQINSLLIKLLSICLFLKEYASSEFFEIHRTGTTASGVGIFEPMIQRSSNPERFEKMCVALGFAGTKEFNALSMQARAAFIVRAIEFCEALFGQNSYGIVKLCEETEETCELVELRLKLLRAEDIDLEVRTGLMNIAAWAKSDIV